MACVRHWLRLVVLVAVSSGIAVAADRKKDGDKPENPTDEVLRITSSEAGDPIALETAIVQCGPKNSRQSGPTVDLIGAIHIGEKSYYRQLNREFEKYDVVLFEMVAARGAPIPRGGGGGSPISAIQRFMTDVLELEYQLDGIDYGKKNFVHADMTPDQMARSMKKKGESMWTMMFRAMGHSIAQQSRSSGQSTDAELLLALFDKNRALALKRVLAKQFGDMEGTMGAFDGTTIITERNKVALETLRKQIDGGKKKVAIFYGAGHLPDMEQRLGEEFGLVRRQTRWLTAWDLSTAVSSATPATTEEPAADKPPRRKKPSKQRPRKIRRQPRSGRTTTG